MKRLGMILMVLLGNTAWAADSPDVMPATAAQIRANIPSLPIDAIRPAPIDGLYELKVGGQIFYSDRTGKHLIASGHIFETKTRKDLTAARLEAINTVDWSSLPLKNAIVSGDPKGLPVAIFTDPNCPYCKKLERELKDAKGIKVYTFLFPLSRIHPTARAHAESIWCAKNQHEALLDLMLKGQTLAKGTCKTPIDENTALAQKLGISGTPTMISADGRKFAGVKSAADLKTWLAGQ
ncbi:MAG: DsbC family protein [Zetaproteobacteria bacterium]|nr:DsbC family protein [Zetaproteobacteria bacterium]